MGFLIRLESVASPQAPENAVRELAALPAVLGLPLHFGVVADVNGIEAFAWSHEDSRGSVAVQRWLRARDSR